MTSKKTIKRSLTSKNVFDKRIARRVKFNNPVLAKAIGEAEKKGCWEIYGAQKNGKTWLTLVLAKDLASTETKKPTYISAEEGTDDSFRLAMQRAGITPDTPILWEDFLSVDQIVEKFSRPKTSDIIFIDNVLMYRNEMQGLKVKTELLDKLPNKLFIFVAHEKNKKPYPGAAETILMLSKVYINVVGLKAFVVSRFAPQGGEIVINEDLSEMYWGSEGAE